MRRALLVVAYQDGLRQCPRCTYWFAPERRDATYCSTACRTGAHHAAQAAQAAAEPGEGTDGP